LFNINKTSKDNNLTVVVTVLLMLMLSCNYTRIYDPGICPTSKFMTAYKSLLLISNHIHIVPVSSQRP